MLSDSKKIHFMLKTLRERYPVVKTQLTHDSPFQLLIATIMAAQCTDNQVNRVTKSLFAKYPEPRDLADAPLDDIKEIIYSTGFYNNKAKHIKACAKSILENYAGVVPKDIDVLIQLPGVGRKTANVVRTVCFGVEAIVVDTHVHRLSRRLGLTRSNDPVKVEFELMELIPQVFWSDLSLQFIYLGREICDAKKPLCNQCPLYEICSTRGK